MHRRTGDGALRRAAALLLGVAALGCLHFASDTAGGTGESVQRLLSAQIPFQPEQTRALEGLERLLLWESPLLSKGEELILSLRDAPAEEEQTHSTAPRLPEAAEETQREDPETPSPAHSAPPLPEAGAEDLSQIVIDNRTGQEVDLAALSVQALQRPTQVGPTVLIYHTHGSEAYTQTEQERYVESDAYRSTDCQHNVVRVGEEIAQALRAQGFEVLHDETLYDYPVYNGSYARSRAGVQKWLEEYPSLWLLLDVHRDAMVSQDGTAYRFVCELDGEESAQVMQVLGSDEGGAEHPRWRENLALAVRVQSALAQRSPGLGRPITLRGTRFNQDLSSGALLVEVGGHGNTLEQALAAARHYAEALGAVLAQP